MVSDERIRESSDLVRSNRSPDLLWTMNDSGDAPRVFGIGRSGLTQSVVTLRGAKAIDWEDLASGRDAELWVGDIGDNAMKRTDVTVYRFREPTTLGDSTVVATAYRLRYPDGPRNAEALMVNQRTGMLYVVSKARDPKRASIYAAPTDLSPTGVNRLTRLGPAPTVVTAAEFEPDSDRFAVRDPDTAYVYDNVGAEPQVVPLPKERQGESLCFGEDNTLLVGSEGRSQPVLTVPF